MPTKQDIASYYNATQIHYERWWDLKNSLSLHYGIWEEGTHSFAEALVNTNKIMMELGQISESDKVLDAGCGVGGTAMYLHNTKKARVTGITLSEKQLLFATSNAKKRNVGDKVAFFLMDFTDTSFEDNSFDVVWACESVCHASDKLAFMKEAYRILKKGGRLIISDFFLTKDQQIDKNSWIKKWSQTWWMSNLVSSSLFSNQLQEQGFQVKKQLDYTKKIQKSAQRMFYASCLGALPSEIYNLFRPSVSLFSKNHYKSGYYQYRALKEDLWKYTIILAEK